MKLGIFKETGHSLKVNANCDLEKVLIRSNGEVQVLVFNSPLRKPVTILSVEKTTWFVN